jgi:hypothetical protein
MREIEWEAETIDALPPARRLVISNKSSLYWTVREISSVQIPRARWRDAQVKFHLDHHTFDEVIVCQGLRAVGPDGGFQLDPLDRLPESFMLAPIVERRWAGRIARLSRVVEIQLAPPLRRAEMGPFPP